MPAPKRPLRAVEPGEGPPPAPKSVTEAARSGTQRELLAAMRDRIAVAVEDETTPARDLAALTKRLADVAREIANLDAKDEEGGDGHYGSDAEDANFDAQAV